MAQGSDDSRSRLAPTLWALLIIVCMLLLVAHLTQAVRQETESPADIVEQTFTTVRPEALRGGVP